MHFLMSKVAAKYGVLILLCEEVNLVQSSVSCGCSLAIKTLSMLLFSIKYLSILNNRRKVNHHVVE